MEFSKLKGAMKERGPPPDEEKFPPRPLQIYGVHGRKYEHEVQDNISMHPDFIICYLCYGINDAD